MDQEHLAKVTNVAEIMSVNEDLKVVRSSNCNC